MLHLERRATAKGTFNLKEHRAGATTDLDFRILRDYRVPGADSLPFALESNAIGEIGTTATSKVD